MIEEKVGDLIRTFRGTLVVGQVKMFDKILERYEGVCKLNEFENMKRSRDFWRERYMLAREDARRGIFRVERKKVNNILKRVEALMREKASDSVVFYRLMGLQAALYNRRAVLKCELEKTV